jgi:hypothetical protein
MRPVSFVLLFGLVLVTSPLAAQVPGDSVKLFLVPPDVVVGSFIERTPDAWRVALQDRDTRLVPTTSVRRAEVQVVRTRHALRRTSMIRGLLTGAAAGFILYTVEIGRQPGEPGLAGLLLLPITAAGATYGAGIGWIVGSVLPEVQWQSVP